MSTDIKGQRTMALYSEEHRDMILDVLASLRLDPLRPWSLTLNAPWIPITPAQRGYYRGAVLRVLCDETGEDEAAMHAYLLTRFGDQALIDVHHEDYCVRTFTTGDANTRPEMTAYIARVVRWAAMEGIFIPSPLRPGA